MNRKPIFAGVILVLAAVGAVLSQTRAPATDGSYGVVRIEPLGSAAARTFRHSLQTRRATTQRTDGRAYRFAYDHDKITTISDEKSGILLEIDYNEFDRVQEMRAGDGSTYRFRYVWDQKGTRVEQASVTVPDGTVYTFDHGTLVPHR
jgi:hypothetical protein